MKLEKNILYEIIMPDCDNDSFDVGMFLAEDGENIIFQNVNVNGFDNGLLLLKKENILNLEFSTKYCESMNKLMQYHKTSFKPIKFKGNNLLIEFLNCAKNNGAIVGLEFKNSDRINLLGFIETISDDYVTTSEINSEGFSTGKGLGKISDITKMTSDAYCHQKYKILFNMNK